MRHGNRINHLGRKYAHRKAMLSNMAASLIMHKRIKTTVAKAKELRSYIEPLINLSKSDSTHHRRTAFSQLQDKEAVTELFNGIGGKVANRNGGYTRILKLGDNRLCGNAEMCYIKLVDHTENMLKETKAAGKKKTRRRGGATAKATEKAPAATAEVVEEKAAPEAEAPAADATPEADDTAEDTPKEEA